MKKRDFFGRRDKNFGFKAVLMMFWWEKGRNRQKQKKAALQRALEANLDSCFHRKGKLDCHALCCNARNDEILRFAQNDNPTLR